MARAQLCHHITAYTVYKLAEPAPRYQRKNTIRGQYRTRCTPHTHTRARPPDSYLDQTFGSKSECRYCGRASHGFPDKSIDSLGPHFCGCCSTCCSSLIIPTLCVSSTTTKETENTLARVCTNASVIGFALAKKLLFRFHAAHSVHVYAYRHTFRKCCADDN